MPRPADVCGGSWQTNVRRWLVLRTLIPRLLLVASTVSLLVLRAPLANAAELSDSETVFCLLQDNRGSLIDAGIALGVLSEGSRVNALRTRNQIFSGPEGVNSWRSKQPNNFKKTCRAFVQSEALAQGNGPKEESRFAFLSWLLPIVIGSLLTMFATAAQGARARRLAAAEEIRLAAGAFRDTLNQYTSEWIESSAGGKPSTGAADQRRMQLIATLRKAGLRGNWPFVEQLIADLGGVRYGGELDVGWTGPQGNARSRAEDVRSRLTRLEADTENVASTVASPVPIRLRRSRKKLPSSVSP